jgi:hypothetical protein
MSTVHEMQSQTYPDVLAGIVQQLHEGHRLLLDSVVEAEEALLAGLALPQRQSFLRYREIASELQTLYQLAAYEAGRQAAAGISPETREQAARAVPELVAGQNSEAEGGSRAPR